GRLLDLSQIGISGVLRRRLGEHQVAEADDDAQLILQRVQQLAFGRWRWVGHDEARKESGDRGVHYTPRTCHYFPSGDGRSQARSKRLDATAARTFVSALDRR